MHPFVLLQVGVVGALGTGRVPGLFSAELPARRLLRATSAPTWPAPFPAGVGFVVDLLAHATAIVDWHACLDPAAEHHSRSAPRTSAWRSTSGSTAGSARRSRVYADGDPLPLAA